MSNERMSVIVWADFVCPYCYLGKRRLDEALARFDHRDGVDVIYNSFELDPHAPVDGNPPTTDMLMEKYGMTREQVEANFQQLTAQGKELGVHFRFADTIRTNTFDAHRLNHYAARQNKQNEMTERVLQAYFAEGRHIGHTETLADLAAEVGLDRAEAMDALNSNAFADEVRADETVARQVGVTGVPFFIIGDTYVVRGAQPSEVLLRTLQQAWDEA